MITLATAADLPRILALYAHARAFMAENGNPNQWGQTRPTEADVAAHIAARELYVLREEGEIHGVFAFILGEDPTYRVIEQGAWLSDAPYGTIHAVASDGQIHGLLSRIVAYCEQTTPHLRIDTIVISTQHDEFVQRLDDTPEAQAAADKEMLEQIRRDVQEVLLPRVIATLPEATQALFKEGYKLYVNPTGKFVLGGPHADTGLTGRKIIVDTYGGRGAHGGGAFSGKDPSKVDRSAAYAMRHIAKNLVAAGVARQVLVQVSYAIGKAEPINIFVNTYGTARPGLTDRQIADAIPQIFDLTPAGIEKRLKLRQPIYLETATYGHMGRKPEILHKVFHSKYADEKAVEMDVELFTWEKLDYAERLRDFFNKLISES